MTRAIGSLVFIAIGLAIAVWLLPASIHIVSWPSSRAVRVALLAPWRTLWILIAAALVVAGAVAGVSARIGGTVSVERIARIVAPVALLWLWLVPYLPWLPDRAPLLLVLAGPLRWGIVALAVIGIAVPLLVGSAVMRTFSESLGRKSAVAGALAIYLTFGLWSANTVGPGGDEPHYLVITQSLVRDHDLDIENNHAGGDYHEYFARPLRPDYLRRGVNGAIYSIHAPGLPALLAPVYAIAGYRGAVVMMCVFAAMTTLAIFDLAALMGGRAAAWGALVTVGLSIPFVPHAWMIYPEIIGALIVARSVLWLHAQEQGDGTSSTGRWIARGAALGLLPWLHTKFAVLLVMLALFLALRLWHGKSVKAIVAVASPIALSTIAWLFSFYRMYGVIDPQAPYAETARTQMALANIPRGLLGLLFDQKFGLLAYSPVYLIAIYGCWVMFRKRDLRVFATTMLVTIAAYVAGTTRFYMWWGGSSAPARFLVPVLPLLVPFIASALHALRSPAGRTVANGLLALSVTIAILGAAWPERFMLFSEPHGFAQIAEVIQGPAPLAVALPTFTEESGLRGPLALLWPWILAGMLALSASVVVSRRRRGSTTFQAVSTAAVIFLFAAAVIARTPSQDARRATAVRGGVGLAHAFDGDRLGGFDYAHGIPLDERGIVAASAISVSRLAGQLTDEAERLAGPFELPPGRYTAHVWVARPLPEGSALFIALRSRARIAETTNASAKPIDLSFELPVDAVVYLGVSNGAVASTVDKVDLSPDSIVPLSARADVSVHALEPIATRPNAYIVYADDHTYPEEGVFWTRGTETAQVFVAPAGAPSLMLTVHVGAAAGKVQLRVDGQDYSVDLSANETRTLEVPTKSSTEDPARAIPHENGDHFVHLAVRSPGQFRPADQERGSPDDRWLGCQVRVSFK